MSLSRISTFFCLFLSLLFVTAACAGGPFTVKKTTTGGVNFFPSADADGNFWFTRNGSLYKTTVSGSAIYEGTVNGGVDCPVKFKNGLALYDTGTGGSRPMVWNWSNGTFSYPSATWPTRPWIAPRVSGNNQKVVFATGHNDIAIYDGTTTTQWNQWDSTKFQLASIDWLNNDTLIAAVQDKYDAVLYGYHLFTLDIATRQATDYGKGFSQVAVAGTDILLTSWDNRSLSRYWMNNGKLQFTESINAPGVTYWDLGGAALTRNGPLFSAIDGQDNLWAIGSPGAVPEPSAILVLGSGLIGLLAAVKRRR